MAMGRTEAPAFLSIPMRMDGSRNGLTESGKAPLLISWINIARPVKQSASSVNTRTISAVQPEGPGAAPLAIWHIILTKPSSSPTTTEGTSADNTGNTLLWGKGNG